MERIVQRPLYWIYLKAVVVCYVSFVGLFVVVDGFANLDEFAKRADGVVEMAQVMGRYYILQQLTYVRCLGPAIAVMAAFFTVPWASREHRDGKGAHP